LAKKRQTLLFSATVTKSLKDIARLNMQENYESIQIDNFDVVYDAETDPLTAEERAANTTLKSITP